MIWKWPNIKQHAEYFVNYVQSKNRSMVNCHFQKYLTIHKTEIPYSFMKRQQQRLLYEDDSGARCLEEKNLDEYISTIFSLRFFAHFDTYHSLIFLSKLG